MFTRDQALVTDFLRNQCGGGGGKIFTSQQQMESSEDSTHIIEHIYSLTAPTKERNGPIYSLELF